jgi:hypothetical protein
LGADPASYKAGVAARIITPTEPIWMAGYGNRTKPAEGKLHDIYVKALALEDRAGTKLVLITSDLLGFPRSLSEDVANEIQRRTGLTRERLLFTSSHTHCGPVVRTTLIDAYPLTPEQLPPLQQYAARLQQDVIDVIEAALKDLKPARLSIGVGQAGFAVNRREERPGGAVINGRNPGGPVDHSVPVLRVDTEGKLRAVAFGYACHNTSLAFYQWCGDYAGFAQAALEAKHPGAIALFWMGCGADANPLPRGKVELCEKYGNELAHAVDDVLGQSMTPLAGNFAARYATISLPFDTLPPKDKWQAESLNKGHGVRNRAVRLLKILEKDGKLDDRYPDYPVAVWRLGDQLLWVSLGGEVVVDYSMRLKKDLGGLRTVWVTGYANDVMAYIPSARVLGEGGYEGDTSMIGYGLPAKWAPGIEARIVEKVKQLVKEVSP